MAYFFGSPTHKAPEEPIYSRKELAQRLGEKPGTLVTYVSSDRILLTDDQGRTSTVPTEKLDPRTVRSIASFYGTAFTNPTTKIKPNNSEEPGESDTAVKEKPALGRK